MDLVLLKIGKHVIGAIKLTEVKFFNIVINYKLPYIYHK